MEVVDSQRMFVSLPKDIYPDENYQFISRGARMGKITGGEGGFNEDINHCAVHYYEFIGSGTVSLHVKSVAQGVPDYLIHFKVRCINNAPN